MSTYCTNYGKLIPIPDLKIDCMVFFLFFRRLNRVAHLTLLISTGERVVKIADFSEIVPLEQRKIISNSP